MRTFDIAVVGGGIAGLTAALYLAKAGKKVVVIEKQERFGGRAMTNHKQGVSLNLGAHAIYLKGEAVGILEELGVKLVGNKPLSEAHGLWKNKLYPLPSGVLSLLRTPLLSWKGKMEFTTFMGKLGKINTDSIPKISLRAWIEKHLHDPMVRNLFYALCRTSTYVVAPDIQVAAPVIKQLQRAFQGVLYIDGGWDTIIQQLRDGATRLGVTMLTNKLAVSIEHDDHVHQVRCADGEIIKTYNVLIATPPNIACNLIQNVERTSLYKWKEQSIPITAACLDLGLRKLPNPKHQFVMGVDQPILLTNQSRAAKLSENGTLAVHLLKYLGHQPSDPHRDKQELEQAMDIMHPGWRKEVVVEQYLSKMTVVHDFMHMERKVNPGPAVPEIKGLYIAGDWVTHGEMIVDAAAASAKRTALQILQVEEKILA